MSGFSKVHVSGLPLVLVDEAVSTELSLLLSCAEDADAGAASSSADPPLPPFVDCVVVRDKDTGLGRGFVFLLFLAKEQAEDAVSVLNAKVAGGATVLGAKISAELSRPKPRLDKRGTKKGKKEDRSEHMHFRKARGKATRKYADSHPDSGTNHKIKYSDSSTSGVGMKSNTCAY